MFKNTLRVILLTIFSNTSFAQQILIEPRVTTLAGTGTYGYVDGVALIAQFADPKGLCVDPNNNIYVADNLNKSLVRKITSNGDVSTLAGTGVQGFKNGTLAEANFSMPSDAIYSATGLLIADNGNHQIRKVASGNVSTFVGSSVFGFQDGVGENAMFRQPYSMVYDKLGNMYVTDLFNHAIRKVTSNGTVTTVAGKGTIGLTNGKGSDVQFSSPMGIAIDSNGVLYVADYQNHVIRKVLQDGTVSTFAGTGIAGFADGKANAAQFNHPQGVAVDKKGNVYVADRDNSRIRIISPNGNVSTYIGTTKGSTDGIGVYAKITNPADVFITTTGVMYISDGGGNKILKSEEITTTTNYNGIEGSISPIQNFSISALDLASSITVNAPAGFEISLSETTGFTNQLSISPNVNGNISGIKVYFRVSSTAVAGNYNSFITINSTGAIEKKISVKATLNPKASFAVICPSYYTSTEIVGGSGYVNGNKSIAKFKMYDIDQDKNGNFFIADAGNNCIRKIDVNGNVTTFAGDALGVAGYVDGNGLAARFKGPVQLAFDQYDNLFVADEGNNCIRKIDKQGNVSTIAGSTTSGYVDANGKAAKFYLPNGITIDSSGNIFVTDYANSKVRKITPNGDVSTFGGAQFNFPRGIDVDDSGNVYVCDQSNQKIKKLDPTGTKTQILSGSTVGYADGEGSVAKFNYPSDLTVGKDGTVYVADYRNNLVRKIYKNGLTFYLGGYSGSSGRIDGYTSISRFSSPFGIMVKDNGELFVVDVGTFSIRKLKEQVLDPFVSFQGLTSTSQTYSILAAGLSSSLNIVLPPNFETSGQKGPIVLTPVNGIINTEINIRLSAKASVGSFKDSIMVSSTGAATLKIPIEGTVSPNAYVYFDKVVSTFAGNGTSGYVEGAASTAQFKSPNGIAVDKKGNVFVSDYNNYVIRKISTDNIVSTFAGSGVKGFKDGTGTAASFGLMNNLAIDTSDNIYVADFGNYAIRKITPEGVVTTVAGLGGQGTMDGPKTIATFGAISGIAIDKDNNLYTSDTKGLRKVTQDGTVSTLTKSYGKSNDLKFGKNGALYSMYSFEYQQMNFPDTIRKSIAGGSSRNGAFNDGFGSNAYFYNAKSFAFDKDGSAYISDGINYRIRKIDANGIVTTLAGNGTVGAVNGFAKSATFGTLAGIATNSNGDVYICDALYNTIRKLSEQVVPVMTTTENIVSKTQSFKIDGLFLTTNLLVTVPAEFEVSASASGTFQNPFNVIPNTSGVVSSTLYVRLKAGLKAGTYSGNIEISSQDAQSKFLPIKGIVSGATGLEDTNLESTITLYPNPVTSSFQLVVDETLFSGAYKLYNSSGILLREGSITENSTSFEMSTQSAGIYNLVINKNGKSITRKFVKQ